MSERMGVDHHCHTPMGGLFRKRRWTCPYCRRTWEASSTGGWRTDETGGEVVGFVMHYPDGYTQAFGKVQA
jgi:transposase-like protein